MYLITCVVLTYFYSNEEPGMREVALAICNTLHMS